jgi:hypothetical protein
MKDNSISEAKSIRQAINMIRTFDIDAVGQAKEWLSTVAGWLLAIIGPITRSSIFRFYALPTVAA